MSHTLCLKNTSEIPKFRQRYNPTFYHQQIFNNYDSDFKKSRYTPTFHSTVLDTEGYNIKTIHKRAQKQAVRPNSAIHGVYSNNTQRKRVQQLNPHNSVFNCSGGQWFDHTKQQMISSLVDCRNHGYSKERKFVQLSSDPVFTDYNYGAPNARIQQQRIIVSNGKPTDQNRIISNDFVRSNEPFDVIPSQKKQPIHIEEKPQKPKNSKDKDANSSHKKDFHRNCIPESDKQLKLKGKQISRRPQTARKSNVVCQKPTFTVIRKNRIPPLC